MLIACVFTYSLLLLFVLACCVAFVIQLIQMIITIYFSMFHFFFVFPERIFCDKTFFIEVTSAKVKNIRFGTPFGIQLGPKWRPKSAKWRQTTSKQTLRWCLFALLDTTFFPNALDSDWLFDGIWLICAIDAGTRLCRFFAIWIELLMDLLLFWNTFFGPMFANVFLKSTKSKQGSDKICQDLPRSNKIKQDQPKDRQA